MFLKDVDFVEALSVRPFVVHMERTGAMILHCVQVDLD